MTDLKVYKESRQNTSLVVVTIIIAKQTRGRTDETVFVLPSCFVHKPTHDTMTILPTDDVSAPPLWIVIRNERKTKRCRSKTETNTK